MTGPLTPPPGGWPPGFPTTGTIAEQVDWVLGAMLDALPRLTRQLGQPDAAEMLDHLTRRGLNHFPRDELAALLAAALMRLDRANRPPGEPT